MERYLNYQEALNTLKRGDEDMSHEQLNAEIENAPKDKPVIDFDTLIDDCVRFVDVVGYVLTLDGKKHTFDDTSKIVTFVQDKLGYTVTF